MPSWFRPFTTLGKGAALGRYLRRLPGFLIRDYGHGGPYRLAQVDATIRRHGFSRRYAAYAKVLFCDPADLGAEFAWPRIDLAKRYFRGNRDFARRHVEAYAPRYAFDDRGEWMFSDGAIGGDGGGHGGDHGGDGGGGH
jgi:hypothetical protein